MAYFGGEITEVPDERAADLVTHGNAVMIPEMIEEIPVIKAYVRKEETIKKQTIRRK